jgi:uncharacterized protein with PQ loop repeat
MRRKEVGGKSGESGEGGAVVRKGVRLAKLSSPSKTEYVALFAGGLTTASVVTQMLQVVKLYRRNESMQALSSIFILLSLIGQLLWIYWSVDLYVTSKGERGLFSIIWGSLSISALISILVLRTNIFREFF